MFQNFANLLSQSQNAIAAAKPSASAKIAEELNKTFNGLTFNWPFFVFSLISLGLVVLIITLLVYKPIKKLIKNRQELIQKNIDTSILAKENALKVQEENDKKIIEANNQAALIINHAKSESERIVNASTIASKKQSELLLDQAQILINKKQSELEQAQKKIIVENAVELAKKIIGREIRNEDNIKLINEVLED